MKTSELPKIESMSSHDEILRKRCERQNEGEEGGGRLRVAPMGKQNNRPSTAKTHFLQWTLSLAANIRLPCARQAPVVRSRPLRLSSRQLTRNHEDKKNYNLLVGIRIQNVVNSGDTD